MKLKIKYYVKGSDLKKMRGLWYKQIEMIDENGDSLLEIK